MATTYTIRIKGHLDPRWSTRLQGMQIQNRPDGTAALTGALADQAALHGLLAQIRDLGLELLALQQTIVQEGITQEGKGDTTHE